MKSFNNKKYQQDPMRKFINQINNFIFENRKEVIFGFGLLKLFNESFKYLKEDDWKLIIHEGINLSYMFDYYEGNSARFFKKLVDIEKICKSPVPKNPLSIPNGLNELFEFAEFNQGTKTINGKTLNQFSDEINIDPVILSMENEEALAYHLTAFLLNFDKNIKEIFNKIDFIHIIFKYNINDELSYILSRLNKINLPEKYFTSLNALVNTINEFIDELCAYEFRRNIKIPFNEKKQLYIEPTVLKDKYLIEFLFNNTNLNKYEKINIYDPCCNNINLIFNSIDFIKSKNNKCEVNFYGKLNFENSIFNTTKVIMYSYLNDNIILSYSNKPGFPFKEISLKKMDFIISDYRTNDIYEDNHFLRPFQNKLNYSSKLVAIFNKKDFYNPFMDFSILNDNLESIITFHDSFILILNSNKLDEKKNKFLLIDYTLSDKEFIPKIEYYRNSKSTNIENILINPAHIDQILKSYVNFTDTHFSKVILNKNAVKDYFHTEAEKYWGYNCKCPSNIIKDSNKKIKKRERYLELGKDMNYHLQKFNFNNLIYDLKRQRHSLVIPNVKENLEYIPLYSIITFDINKLNVKNPDEYKIEAYGYSFYINCYKIKRDFLLYYLDSENGKEEYDYFKNGFGFENDYELTAENFHTCKFIYTRIPLLDIGIQEKILAKQDESLSFDSLITVILQEVKEMRNQIIENSNSNTEKTIKNSNKNTEKIIDEIDKLGEQLKQLNIDIADYKKEVHELLNNTDSNDEEKEEIISNFTDKCVKRIRSSLEDKIVGTHEYTLEENKLIDSLGKSAWNKLSKESQTFLTTAKVTFNNLNKLEDTIDYSGVCLSVTKALEQELRKRFIDGFIDYLDNKYDYDYKVYHSFLCEYNPRTNQFKKMKDGRKTLGVIPHILGSSYESKKRLEEIRTNDILKLIEYSKYALFDEENHDDEEIETTLHDYGSKINSIKDKYRNKAAHTYRIEQTKAKECLDFVIDVEHFLKTMLDSFDKE